MNKSFRFNEPELTWLSDLKEITGYSETDIVRYSLCSFYFRVVPEDLVTFDSVRDKYQEAADYFKYKRLQKKVFT